jgi:ABC-type dipeptide/oligopeptide/nickel transport system ATPase component
MTKRNDTDFYKTVEKNKKNKNKNKELKTDFGIFKLPVRCGFFGASGSGKTHSVMQVIRELNGVFSKVYIISPNVREPLYEYLQERNPESVDLINYEKHTDIPEMNDIADPDDHVLVIFDDMLVVSDKHALKKMSDYFVRARHKNISVFFCSQSYYTTPKLIRQQMNYCAVKKFSSKKDITRMLREHQITDLETFTDCYRQSTTDHTNFLLLDLGRSKIFHNFDEFDIEPEF